MLTKVIKQIGGAEVEADVLKEKILSAKSEVMLTDRTYYFSQKGNDDNSGLSPESALKNYVMLETLPLEAGDTVLFERGSVFRASERIELVSGVNYGAYGDGEKPKILGSLKDYANSAYWRASDVENVWEAYLSHTQAGGITFDNESFFGERKQKKDLLKTNGDFYHDTASGIFYLFYDGGNPGEAFNNIEIATTMDFMRAFNVENVTVDNLCFKFATFGPFIIHRSKNIKICNCEMGWHGGKLFSTLDRGPIYYGNAVEFWYRADNVSVENCYIYQVFDAAMTFQGDAEEEPRFTNIRFENNLIEYCCMNIEFWAGKNQGEPHIANISYKGNIIRFGGYGWGGIHRVDKEDQALLLNWNGTYDDMNDFVITDNIFDCADCYMIYFPSPKIQKGLAVYGNTYYQKNVTGTHDCIEIVKGKEYMPTGQKEFEEAVNYFDSEPKLIKWLSE